MLPLYANFMGFQQKIAIVKTDITQLQVDAVVNAANNSLLGGGGVDGAIHRAAGPELLSECKTLNGCATGDAKVTAGYRLKAPFVIHTVGPVWHGGNKGEAELLALCYRNALKQAVAKKLKSIAFPNISTGVYGYPKSEAAEIALTAVNRFLSEDSTIEKVIFAIFDDENLEIYQQLSRKF